MPVFLFPEPVTLQGGSLQKGEAFAQPLSSGVAILLQRRILEYVNIETKKVYRKAKQRKDSTQPRHECGYI
jgi:hypothetical protein